MPVPSSTLCAAENSCPGSRRPSSSVSAGISSRVDFPAGAELLTADRLNDCVYVIESGIAEVLRVRGRNEERIARVDRGSCLGEMSALAHRPVAMTVRAVTPIRALSFDGAALLRALIEVPRLGGESCVRLDRAASRQPRPADGAHGRCRAG